MPHRHLWRPWGYYQELESLCYSRLFPLSVLCHIQQVSGKFDDHYLLSVSELNKLCLFLFISFRLNLGSICRRINKTYCYNSLL